MKKESGESSSEGQVQGELVFGGRGAGEPFRAAKFDVFVVQ
jgi:hypothetical protein